MSGAGLRGEDTGIFACQKLDNNDIIAYVDVVVYGKNAVSSTFHVMLCNVNVSILKRWRRQ